MRGSRDSTRAIKPTMKPERAITPLGDSAYFVIQTKGESVLVNTLNNLMSSSFTLTSYKVITHTLSAGDLQVFMEYKFNGSWERFDFVCLETQGHMTMEDTLPPEHVITSSEFRIFVQGSCQNFKIHCLIEGLQN